MSILLNCLNWSLTEIPNHDTYNIVGFGFCVFILSQFFRDFIPILYRILLTVICFFLMLSGSWLNGRQSIVKEDAKIIEKIVTQEKIVTKVVVQKYKDNVNKIEDNHEKFIESINTKDNSMCTVPESFVLLHNSAASGVPNTTTGVNGTTSGVTLSDVERTIADNYEQYNKVAEQLRDLQSWIQQQESIDK